MTGLAVWSDDDDAIAQLVAAGAAVDKVDAEGLTALVRAAKLLRHRCVRRYA